MAKGMTVCMRVEGYDIIHLIEGSKKGRCSKCNEPVWISPATAKSIKTGLYSPRIVCMDCFTKKTKEEK